MCVCMRMCVLTVRLLALARARCDSKQAQNQNLRVATHGVRTDTTNKDTHREAR